MDGVVKMESDAGTEQQTTAEPPNANNVLTPEEIEAKMTSLLQKVEQLEKNKDDLRAQAESAQQQPGLPLKVKGFIARSFHFG